ncbi:MAG: hypothetical protein MUE60_15240 [Candidatus Eisenbacteria bacterium]|nr:hypothetical protein [Candidatus Eisenbacteria bacterium]
MGIDCRGREIAGLTAVVLLAVQKLPQQPATSVFRDILDVELAVAISIEQRAKEPRLGSAVDTAFFVAASSVPSCVSILHSSLALGRCDSISSMDAMALSSPLGLPDACCWG